MRDTVSGSKGTPAPTPPPISEDEEMWNLTMYQALSIWSELWQAYYGENGYGGDTAEIYAYRLRPDNPGLKLSQDTERYKQANIASAAIASSNLQNLLLSFESDAECKIEVDGKSINEWVSTTIFDHRCHVKVIKDVLNV